MADETYIHREHVAGPDAPLLVVLHGTGGDENQFFELGRGLCPAAGLLAPRGDVSELGAARFFRRRAEGLYDMDDLSRATRKLAGFVRAKAAERRSSGVLGLGYSNGANILANILLTEPDLFDNAVLMHPLIPFEPAAGDGQAGQRILITAGRADPICPPPLTERLAEAFRRRDARVELAWHPGGHEIAKSEIAAVAAFLAASGAAAAP